MIEKKISPVFDNAMEIMSNCFGGTTIEVISDELIRLEPDEFNLGGQLGAYIKICDVKMFFPYSLAEDFMMPYGKTQAEDFITNILQKSFTFTFDEIRRALFNSPKHKVLVKAMEAVDDSFDHEIETIDPTMALYRLISIKYGPKINNAFFNIK